MHALTREEVKRLVEAIPNELWRLMVLVAFWHGLRVSEVINLRGRDIRDGYVNCKRLKGSEQTIQRYVDCRTTDPELDESDGLRRLALLVGPEQRLFNITRFGVYKLMQRAGKVAGIALAEDRCHPHILKHSIATQTIKAAGIENVKQRLGHKSLASTGFYLRCTDDQAADAIEAAMGIK